MAYANDEAAVAGEAALVAGKATWEDPLFPANGEAMYKDPFKPPRGACVCGGGGPVCCPRLWRWKLDLFVTCLCLAFCPRPTVVPADAGCSPRVAEIVYL